jgi:hypothetical protein
MSTTTRLYDRREILAAAASAAAAACLPFSSLATPALGAPARSERLADWSVDDQWGIVPRWDAIPCVPQHRDDARLALAHPVDRGFLA